MKKSILLSLLIISTGVLSSGIGALSSGTGVLSSLSKKSAELQAVSFNKTMFKRNLGSAD
jgi:X-X-X-Leu-X-X-Gly heptad repeat protein